MLKQQMVEKGYSESQNADDAEIAVSIYSSDESNWLLLHLTVSILIMQIAQRQLQHRFPKSLKQMLLRQPALTATSL